MRYIIFGAGGQLGQAFQVLFAKEGKDCLAFDIEKADITNFKLLRQIFESARPAVVFNCAAYNQVDMAEQEWGKAYLVNGVAVKNLALLAREYSSVLVHYSTDYVFDGAKKSPYTIADRPNPLSRYGESKLLGEEFVKTFGEKFYLIRLSWVFGKGNENFVTKLLRWAQEKSELKVVTDQVSSPSYTRDIAGATLKLLDNGEYGLYHLANTGLCSRYEWSRFILERIGYTGSIRPALSADFNLPAKRPGFSALDSFPYSYITGCELQTWQDATEQFLKETGVI